MNKKIFIIVLMIAAMEIRAYADEIKWVRIPIYIKDEMSCIARDAISSDILYIGTDKRLYRSHDRGLTWQVVYTCTGEQKGINDIYTDCDSKIYLATKNGLFVSDRDGNWQWASRGKNRDNRNINSIAFNKDKNMIFIVTDSGLYKTNSLENKWERLYTREKDAEREADEETEEYESEDNIIFKKINIDKEDNLYLATNKGLLKSSDMGISWKRLSEEGLYNRDINDCLIQWQNPGKIYLATENGVFEYIVDENKWRSMSDGLNSAKIKSLSFDSEKENSLWCVADNEIYRTVNEDNYFQVLASNFNNEPSIMQVQDMAIKYAEVHPDKISKWRQGAKYRAILPKVTFGIDKSASDTYDIYTSSSTSYAMSGPRDLTEGWDILLSWDLADLVYNEHQTSIDVRSKLMAQLREEILNEVTRLYFERRRLQMKLAANEPIIETKKIDEELRLQELTASIDAMTGGAFSERIRKNS